MAETPPVYVISRARPGDVRAGVTVHAVFDSNRSNARLRDAVAYAPSASHLPWDVRHAAVAAITGRVVSIGNTAHGVVFELRDGRATRRITVACDAPFFSLAPGTRADLPAGRAALVVASKTDVGLYGVTQAIVVGQDASVPSL